MENKIRVHFLAISRHHHQNHQCVFCWTEIRKIKTKCECTCMYNAQHFRQNGFSNPRSMDPFPSQCSTLTAASPGLVQCKSLCWASKYRLHKLLHKNSDFFKILQSLIKHQFYFHIVGLLIPTLGNVKKMLQLGSTFHNNCSNEKRWEISIAVYVTTPCNLYCNKNARQVKLHEACLV